MQEEYCGIDCNRILTIYIYIYTYTHMMQYPDIWDGYHHMLLCYITDYNSSSACFLFFWGMPYCLWHIVCALQFVFLADASTNMGYCLRFLGWTTKKKTPETIIFPLFDGLKLEVSPIFIQTHMSYWSPAYIYITILYIYYKCYSYCCLYWPIYPKTYHHRTVGWYPDVSYLHPH